MKKGKPVSSKRGPKRKLSEEAMKVAVAEHAAAEAAVDQKAKTRLGRKGTGVSGILESEMPSILDRTLVIQRKLTTGGTGGVAGVSQRTQRRFKKELDQVEKAQRQTKRRAQAMGDLRNAVSAAAVSRAVLYADPENMLGAIVGSALANMDATTVVLHTEGVHAERS